MERIGLGDFLGEEAGTRLMGESEMPRQVRRADDFLHIAGSNLAQNPVGGVVGEGVGDRGRRTVRQGLADGERIAVSIVGVAGGHGGIGRTIEVLCRRNALAEINEIGTAAQIDRGIGVGDGRKRHPTQDGRLGRDRADVRQVGAEIRRGDDIGLQIGDGDRGEADEPRDRQIGWRAGVGDGGDAGLGAPIGVGLAVIAADAVGDIEPRHGVLGAVQILGGIGGAGALGIERAVLVQAVVSDGGGGAQPVRNAGHQLGHEGKEIFRVAGTYLHPQIGRRRHCSSPPRRRQSRSTCWRWW